MGIGTILLLAFLIIMITVGLVALFLKASTSWNRGWLTFLTLSIIAGTLAILLTPVGGLPLLIGLWIVMLLVAIAMGGWMSWKSYNEHQGRFNFSQNAEPRYTQEEMRGLAGTRNAVFVYVAVLVAFLGIMFLVRFLLGL